MANININTDVLEDKIVELINLKNECVEYGNLRPDNIGGGLTITELQKLVDTYDQLDKTFIEILNNTILFMMNVQKSFILSDKNAAKGNKGAD